MTGRSVVPALTTAILRGSRGSGFRSTTIHRPTDSNRASGSAWITFLNWLGLARVANATPFFSTSVSRIFVRSSGLLPSANAASGKPRLSNRPTSTLAKSKSAKSGITAIESGVNEVPRLPLSRGALGSCRTVEIHASRKRPASPRSFDP